jgi:hypothetical protein
MTTPTFHGIVPGSKSFPQLPLVYHYTAAFSTPHKRPQQFLAGRWFHPEGRQ